MKLKILVILLVFCMLFSACATVTQRWPSGSHEDHYYYLGGGMNYGDPTPIYRQSIYGGEPELIFDGIEKMYSYYGFNSAKYMGFAHAEAEGLDVYDSKTGKVKTLEGYLVRSIFNAENAVVYTACEIESKTFGLFSYYPKTDETIVIDTAKGIYIDTWIIEEFNIRIGGGDILIYQYGETVEPFFEEYRMYNLASKKHLGILPTDIAVRCFGTTDSRIYYYEDIADGQRVIKAHDPNSLETETIPFMLSAEEFPFIYSSAGTWTMNSNVISYIGESERKEFTIDENYTASAFVLSGQNMLLRAIDNDTGNVKYYSAVSSTGELIDITAAR